MSDSNARSTPSPIPPPPSQLPAPTGNIITDVKAAILNLDQIPCARNSLVSGIVSGAGIGFIRGMSVPPIIAGHWFAATFVVISAGTWHLCQKQIADERQKVIQIIERTPKHVFKKDEAASPTSSTPS